MSAKNIKSIKNIKNISQKDLSNIEQLLHTHDIVTNPICIITLIHGAVLFLQTTDVVFGLNDKINKISKNAYELTTSFEFNRKCIFHYNKNITTQKGILLDETQKNEIAYNKHNNTFSTDTDIDSYCVFEKIKNGLCIKINGYTINSIGKPHTNHLIPPQVFHVYTYYDIMNCIKEVKNHPEEIKLQSWAIDIDNDNTTNDNISELYMLIKNKALHRGTLALLYSIMGDSFGSRYQFCPSSVATELIKNDYDYSENDPLPFKDYIKQFELLSGGCFNTAHGCVTSIMQMMFANMKACTDYFNCDRYFRQQYRDYAKKEYVNWANTNPFDIEPNIKTTLLNKINNFDQDGNFLARGIGHIVTSISYDDSMENVIKISKQDCSITNTSNETTIIMTMYAQMVTMLISGTSYEIIFDYAISYGKSEATFSKAFFEVYEHISENEQIIFTIDDPINGLVQIDTEKTTGIEWNTWYHSIGFVLKILKFASWRLNFMESLKRIACYGGNTSTHCSISAIFLSVFCPHDTVPIDWFKTILSFENKTDVNPYKLHHPEIWTSVLLNLDKRLKNGLYTKN
jgi:hypothetical protein